MHSTFSATHLTGASLQLHAVYRAFPGGVVAVEKMDLSIQAGEFVSILGPSGCGKSTLLRIIAGLDQPTSGALTVGDRKPISKAFVFQDAHLIPWRTVLANVALPLELMGVARDVRLFQAEQEVIRVGLGDALHRYPAQLSGGMRMRASLARALVTNPNLLLLDEPFAALDEITRQQLDEQLHQLWRERKITVLFVTHSIIEAAFLAQRAIVLTRRPARTVIDHTLALPEHRTAALRTAPEFSVQMRILFDALQQGERVAP